MKSKTLGLFALSIFIVAAFAAFASAITLTEWNFEDSTLTASTDITSGATVALSDSRTATFPAGNAPSAVASMSSAAWNVADRYIEIDLSTANYENIIIQFDEQASATGPTEFKVQYSSDGTTFTELSATPTSTVAAFTANPMHTFDFSSITSIDNNANTKFRIVVNASGVGSDALGTFRIDNLNVAGSLSTSFCSSGAINDTDLKLNVDINNRGEGDDEEWLPLDLIEIEVELDNNKDSSGDGDLDDVILELGLFKQGSSSNIIDEMMWISTDDEEREVGDIDEDEKDSWLFEFRVDPNEVEDSNYILKVKAYPDGDESETCIDHSEDLLDSSFGSTSDTYAEIDVTTENEKEKMVVVDKASYPSVINAFCSSKASFTADVYNIGDEDFLDQIKVSLISDELGINEEVVSNGDLDEGDKTSVLFSFDVPSGVDEKTYTLSMRTFYDYDEDDEMYEEVSEDTFFAYLSVEGNCEPTSGATVSANLESGGEAGEQLVIKSTITNTGDVTADYLLNSAGYSLWASSVDSTPSAFTLGAGESREVTITFDVKEDASGENSFNIEVVSGNELVSSQPVSVSIEGKKGFLTGGAIGVGNGVVWGFALLNIILVLAIIIVAVRVLRR